MPPPVLRSRGLSNLHSRLIAELEAGSEEAASQLWNLNFPPLVRFFRAWLGKRRRGLEDEEDLALAVLQRVIVLARKQVLSKVAADGRFASFLMLIARRTLLSHRRFERRLKRGGAGFASQPFSELDWLPAPSAGCEDRITFEDELARLLRLIGDPQTRRIVELRCEGFRNCEIATLLCIARRTVERRLGVIQQRWTLPASRKERAGFTPPEFPRRSVG